jgi:hypothetical protein
MRPAAGRLEAEALRKGAQADTTPQTAGRYDDRDAARREGSGVSPPRPIYTEGGPFFAAARFHAQCAVDHAREPECAAGNSRRRSGLCPPRGRGSPLLIRAGGHVSGTVTYGEIEIESGGGISGTIEQAGANHPDLISLSA